MSVSGAENREVIQRLSDCLEPRLTEWFRVGATLDMTSYTLEKRPFSFIIRYDVRCIGHKDTAIFVRIPHNSQFNTLAKAVQADDGLRVRTRRYFDSTTAIADVFAGTEVCFIRPLAQLPSFNAAITESLPSQSLRELFDQPSMMMGQKKPRQQFAGYLEKAGGWLRLYHQNVGDLALQSFSHDDAISAVNHELDKLSMWAGDVVQIEWLREQCYGLAKAIADTSIPFAWLHDDFHYANILLAENGRVCGLDASIGKNRRAVYVDLAKLIIDPLTIKRQWLSYGVALPPHRAKPFTQAILQGYFEQEEVDAAVLKFYMMLALIDKWAYLEKRRQNLGSSSGVKRTLSFFWRGYFQRLSRFILTAEANTLFSAPSNV